MLQILLKIGGHKQKGWEPELHMFVGLGKEKKWRKEFGSEGQRVTKFLQPLRNDPANFACSAKMLFPTKMACEILQCENVLFCENDMQNFAQRNTL